VGLCGNRTLIKAFRSKGLACSAAETLTEAFIVENRDCLSSGVGTYCGKSSKDAFLHALFRGMLCGWVAFWRHMLEIV
jgi:hypothetical protein